MAINPAEEDKRNVTVDKIWSRVTWVDLVDSKTQLMNYYFYFLILIMLGFGEPLYFKLNDQTLPDSRLAKVVFEELVITYQIDTIAILPLIGKKLLSKYFQKTFWSY